MGKRSPGKFARNPRDLYSTPWKAVPYLMPHVTERVFAEPCEGEGALIKHLESCELQCRYHGDIADGKDALDWLPGADIAQIITNPPWSWVLLKPLLEHFIFNCRVPVWLLLDADLMHNVRMHRFMNRCFKIVSVGRVKWIEDSEHQGLDNIAWYGFNHKHIGYPVFVPR
jgi:hypothetical protein